MELLRYSQRLLRKQKLKTSRQTSRLKALKLLLNNCLLKSNQAVLGRVQIKRRTCPKEVPDGFFCVMGGCEGRLGRGRAAPIKYSVFPCAEHSDEPPKSRNRVRQWASRFPEFHLHCTKRNTPYLIGAALTPAFV